MDKTPGQEVAELFHDTYERLAPSFGYETRADTKKFDPESKNGKLMVATCAAVIAHVTPQIRAAAIEDAKKVCVDLVGTELNHTGMDCAYAIANLVTLPPSHVCVPVDLLDTLCSEEGAEQKDLNIARALLSTAKEQSK